MLAIAEILVLALIVITLAPETPLAKSLRFWLVERPADRLSEVTPMKIIVGLIVVACLVVLMAEPATFTIISIADLSASLSAYLDAAIIVSLIGAAARLKVTLTEVNRLSRIVRTRFSARFGRHRVRNRRLRVRRPKVRPSSGDADPPGDWVFAYPCCGNAKL